MKKPLIMGMGVTGRSISRYLSNQSIHHLVMDSCSSKNINLTSYVDKFLFSEDASILKEVSKVFVSPGVDSNNIFLNETIKREIPISTDLDLYLSQTKSKPILITGTNGKTSVTRMTEFLLSKFYGEEKVALGGNIGEPALDLLSKDIEYSVIEVSSFQLEYIQQIRSEISVFLNLGQDHLNRHKTLEEYRRIKERIFLNSNFLIFQDSTSPLQSNEQVSLNFLSEFKEVNEDIKSLLPKGWPEYETMNLKASISIYMALEMLKHNSVNFSKIDFIKENLEKIMRFYNDFSRSPHRFDVLGTINNALYIDDSKSTNVSSMINALDSARQIKDGKEVILILGGDAKGQDFQSINKSSLRGVKSVIIFGKDSNLICDSINSKCNCDVVENLEDAVNLSKNIAKKDDIILLSPACSSLDMYKNYKERGLHFRSLSGF